MTDLTPPATPVWPPVAEPRPAAPKMKRGLLVGIIAGGVVLLLLIAGGAWAIVNTFLGGNESATASAKAFPATTMAWTEIAINPSNGQKVESIGFIDKLDSLRDGVEDSDIDIDFDDPASNDLREVLWNLLTDSDESSIDTDLDFDDDIKPWLGSRLAVGMLPTEDIVEDGPQLLIALEASNTDAGIDAMEDFVDDADIDADVSAKNGYVLISSEDVDLDDAFDDGTLAETDGFTAASKNAGGWGLLSYYADYEQLAGLYVTALSATAGDGDQSDLGYWIEQVENDPYAYAPDAEYEYTGDFDECYALTGDYYCDELGYYYDGSYYLDYSEYAQAYVDDHSEELAQEKLDAWQEQQDALENLAAQFEGRAEFGVLRFVDDSLEVEGSATGVQNLGSADVDGDSFGALPDSTIAAFSVAGLAEALDAGLTDESLSLGSTLGGAAYAYGLGGNTSESLTRDDVIDYLDENFGIDFPDDLDTLLGQQLIVSLDSGVDFDAISSGDESAFSDFVESGLAITIVTKDADETVDAWEDLLDNLEEQSGTDLGLSVEANGNRVVISSGDYLDSVLDPSDTMSDTDSYKRALPNADGSATSFYVDVQQLADLISDVSGSDDFSDYLDGLEAIGFTSTLTSKDSYDYVYRLTTEAD